MLERLSKSPSGRSTPIGLVTLALILSGCAVKPDPVGPQKRLEHMSHLASAFKDQEPLGGPISLEEAMARAIKYNLANRQQVLETVVSSRQLNVTSFDQLPQLVASAGYSIRNNQEFTRGLVETGPTTGLFSTSSDRARGNADIALSWSILDFGVSYLRAQQAADQMLVTQERRRRALLQLLNDVRNTYWNLAAAQVVAGEVDQLIVRIEDALDRMQQAKSQNLAGRDSNAVQRDLITMLRRLMAQRNSVQMLRAELSTLIGLRPGTEFQVAQPDPEFLELPEVNLPIERLEEAALAIRPEIAEEFYQGRVTRNDVMRTMLTLFPDLRLRAGASYDSNSFLRNNSWLGSAAQASWNLLNLFSYPSRARLNEAVKELNEARKLAIGAAILTQVHVARDAYEAAQKDLAIAADLHRVERASLQEIRNARRASAASDIEEIQAEVRATAARLDLLVSFANLQAQLGRLYSAIGVLPIEGDAETQGLGTIRTSLANSLKKPLHILIENALRDTPS